jgi:cyclohexanone monooxygenase
MSDTESHLYRYSWDLELLKEHPWPEHYVRLRCLPVKVTHQLENSPSKPMLWPTWSMCAIAMILYVAFRSKDLCLWFPQRKDMEFSTDVTDATWDEQAEVWRVKTSKGASLTVRYLVTALGPLSALNWPDIPGRDTFKGVRSPRVVLRRSEVFICRNFCTRATGRTSTI